jgi:glycolate oxidase
MTGIAGIATTTGVPLYTFAHAGDGNLHPIIALEDAHGAPVPAERVHGAEDLIVRLALSLGGTLTGEHGVGALKQPWVGAEIDGPSLAVHQRVKDALDPQHLLNPGKLLPAPAPGGPAPRTHQTATANHR